MIQKKSMEKREAPRVTETTLKLNMTMVRIIKLKVAPKKRGTMDVNLVKMK